MSQEATIIAVDDSDFMRNGDFPPSRLQAQNEAVSLICQSKRQKNPENTLGLLSMAKTQVLCTLTNDPSKLYNRLHMVEPKGNINFCTSIQIAHLALRHRQLRHQRMRIVCFVGSPILDDDKSMTRLAKRLKKEKVNVDVINFGEIESNQQKLVDFIDTLNGKDGGYSHLVLVPPGCVLHDSLLTSHVVDGGALSNGGLGLGFGLDANEDPDFFYALRVSMEDQLRRQEQDDAAAAGGAGNVPTSLPAGTGTSEEAMLEQALTMSMDMNAAGTRPAGRMDIDLAAMTEEEQIAYVLEMSMQQQNDVPPSSKMAEKPDASVALMEVDQPAPSIGGGTLASAAAAVLGLPVQEANTTGGTDLDVIHDAEFLQSVLQSLPGVDTKNEEVRKAISALSKSNPSQPEKKDDTKKDDAAGGSTSGSAKP